MMIFVFSSQRERQEDKNNICFVCNGGKRSTASKLGLHIPPRRAKQISKINRLYGTRTSCAFCAAAARHHVERVRVSFDRSMIDNKCAFPPPVMSASFFFFYRRVVVAVVVVIVDDVVAAAVEVSPSHDHTTRAHRRETAPPCPFCFNFYYELSRVVPSSLPRHGIDNESVRLACLPCVLLLLPSLFVIAVFLVIVVSVLFSQLAAYVNYSRQMML